MQYHKITTDTPFEFEAGGSLPSIDIVFHTSPHERREGEKVIWLCHALTANSEAEDWWPHLVGSGKLLDTDKYYVVCVNMLASPYGTSCPASIDPTTGKPYYLTFPKTTVHDIARSLSIVRKHLGIEKIDLLIGSSIGGFQAIEWAVTEPDIFENVAFIATAPRVSPWLSAQAAAQRMAIDADQTFKACESLEGGSLGLQCARAQALISYRCYQGYGITQTEPDENCLFAERADSYERYQGVKLVKRGFDAYSYYYICYELDSHNVGRNRGGVAAALGTIKANALVVNIDTDVIFPPCEGRVWSAMIPGAKYLEISSNYGHDGFLLEIEKLTELLKPLL